LLSTTSISDEKFKRYELGWMNRRTVWSTKFFSRSIIREWGTLEFRLRVLKTRGPGATSLT
jgi:hypothetical protein